MLYSKVKKIILLLPFIVLVHHSAKAQRFETGITFGPNLTTVNGMDDRDFDNDAFKLGFTLGALANTHLDNKNVLQFEANFTQAGASQAPDSLQNNSFKLTLNYLNAAVVLRHRVYFKLSGNPIDKVDLEIGFSAGRLLSEYYVLNNSPISLTSEKFNFTTENAFIGIDYNFSQNFYFGFRYTNSFQPIEQRGTVAYYASAYTWNRGHNEIFDFSFHIIFGKRSVGNTDKPIQSP